MANEQATKTDEHQDPTESPFTRPGFLISAVVIGLIVVLGVVVTVRIAGDNSSANSPPVSIAPTGSTSSTPNASADPAASVCGLPAGTDTDPLTVAPAVIWNYQGTIAYPRSPESGPGKTAQQGYRYCFQHSPSGAVVMAANALAQGSDPELGESWAGYALAEGRYREQLADEIGAATGTQGSRLKVAGFRVLSYDGATARIDLGVEG